MCEKIQLTVLPTVLLHLFIYLHFQWIPSPHILLALMSKCPCLRQSQMLHTLLSVLQCTSNKVTVLTSEAINKAALLPADDVLKKYSKLKGASRAGELAVKLAMETFLESRCLLCVRSKVAVTYQLCHLLSCSN